MTDQERKCQKTGCETPASFLKKDGEGRWWCDSHRPGNEGVMADRGRKGGKNRTQALDPGELPRVTDFESAMEVLARVIEAVADGRLPPKRANAVSRAVGRWKELRSEKIGEERIGAIEERLDELDRTRERKPWE